MTAVLSVFNRCLQADSWRVVSASDDRTIKVVDQIVCFVTSCSFYCVLLCWQCPHCVSQLAVNWLVIKYIIRSLSLGHPPGRAGDISQTVLKATVYGVYLSTTTPHTAADLSRWAISRGHSKSMPTTCWQSISHKNQLTHCVTSGLQKRNAKKLLKQWKLKTKNQS